MPSLIGTIGPNVAPPSADCIDTTYWRAATSETFGPSMRITGGCTPEVAPCVASRICGAGHLRVPRGMRHSAIASPLACCAYQATSAVPAASTSTVGVSPVPGRRVSFADAIAGQDGEDRQRDQQGPAHRVQTAGDLRSLPRTARTTSSTSIVPMMAPRIPPRSNLSLSPMPIT